MNFYPAKKIKIYTGNKEKERWHHASLRKWNLPALLRGWRGGLNKMEQDFFPLYPNFLLPRKTFTRILKAWRMKEEEEEGNYYEEEVGGRRKRVRNIRETQREFCSLSLAAVRHGTKMAHWATNEPN